MYVLEWTKRFASPRVISSRLKAYLERVGLKTASVITMMMDEAAIATYIGCWLALLELSFKASLSSPSSPFSRSRFSADMRNASRSWPNVNYQPFWSLSSLT